MNTPILLCLHGWGGSRESFTELCTALRGTNVELLTPDLPGFGREKEPTEPWSVDDYADWTEAWLRKNIDQSGDKPLRVKGLHLLGHSHGGRIALTLAARQSIPIEHLYLCAAAGIRHPRHLRRIVGLTLAKSGKFFLNIPGLKLLRPIARKFLYRLIRVHDYEKASPMMQKTLQRVTGEDLRPLLPQIHQPTDIFWGIGDRQTPIGDAYLMKRRIRGSTLHVYENVRHSVHRDRAKEIAGVIRRNLG